MARKSDDRGRRVLGSARPSGRAHRAPRLIEERDHWKRRSEHLEKELEAARRAGRRQAAPFAKDRPQGRGGRPGRRAGAEYGRQGRRRPPTQADETHVAPAPTSCPVRRRGRAGPCGVAVSGRPARGASPRAALRHRGGPLLAVSAARQGRHALQTSDALGAGRSTGPERRRAGRRVAHRAGHAAGEGRPRSADAVRTVGDQGRPGPTAAPHRRRGGARVCGAARAGPLQSGGHAG